MFSVTAMEITSTKWNGTLRTWSGATCKCGRPALRVRTATLAVSRPFCDLRASDFRWLRSRRFVCSWTWLALCCNNFQIWRSSTWSVIREPLWTRDTTWWTGADCNRIASIRPGCVMTSPAIWRPLSNCFTCIQTDWLWSSTKRWLLSRWKRSKAFSNFPGFPCCHLSARRYNNTPPVTGRALVARSTSRSIASTSGSRNWTTVRSTTFRQSAPASWSVWVTRAFEFSSFEDACLWQRISIQKILYSKVVLSNCYKMLSNYTVS